MQQLHAHVNAHVTLQQLATQFAVQQQLSIHTEELDTSTVDAFLMYYFDYLEDDYPQTRDDFISNVYYYLNSFK